MTGVGEGELPGPDPNPGTPSTGRSIGPAPVEATAPDGERAATRRVASTAMDSDGIGETIRAAPERAMRSALLALSHRRVLGRMATATPLTRPFVERFVAG